MATFFTKEDLSFLLEPMDRKLKSRARLLLAEPEKVDKVKGDMSIPDPVVVNVNGTMSQEDYKACSMVMAVCQNMVQKTVTDAAKSAGMEASVALKNMDAWITGYVDFPFPFFTFKDTQSDVFNKKEFSLNADPEIVEQVVNIKGVAGLKDAVVGALKKTEGNIVSYQGTDRDFNYFGIITAYNETEIATRVIKFGMKLKTTDTKALCVTYKSTELNTFYDTYQFVADKNLMIKMQSKMGDQLIEYMADKLLEFIKAFYDTQLIAYKEKITKILKG